MVWRDAQQAMNEGEMPRRRHSRAGVRAAAAFMLSRLAAGQRITAAMMTRHCFGIPTVDSRGFRAYAFLDGLLAADALRYHIYIAAVANA